MENKENIISDEKEKEEAELQEIKEKAYKYDLIAEDYEAVLKMAAVKNLSVKDFLNTLKQNEKADIRNGFFEKYAEDEELKSYILELEAKREAEADTELLEINKYFPEIKSLSDIPKEVIVSAKMRGTGLLLEYLLYIRQKALIKRDLEKNKESANKTSIGSQRESLCADYDPSKLQFIKGIWNR